MMEIFGEPVFTYTREQAIEDGVLVDLTPLMKQYDMVVFKHPLACTSTVWEVVIAWDEDDGRGQSVSGRLWDVLNQALRAIKQNHDPSSSFVSFDCYSKKAGDKGGVDCELKIHIGPGDQGEPVMTIMFENED